MSQKNTYKNPEQIEIRSEEIEDILGVPPRRIVRWGMTILFLIIFGLFVGSWFFEYPEIIPAPIEVTSENPPAYIAARVDGKIHRLFVDDKDRVVRGQHLALIENPAAYRDVMEIQIQQDTTNTDFMRESVMVASQILTAKDYDLGELQQYWVNYITAIEDYRYFLEIDYHKQKVESLEEELAMYNDYYERVARQVNIREEDLNLTEKDYQRYMDLYDSSVISQVDLEKSKSDFLQKELSYEEARTDLANTLITISKIEQDILDLELQEERDDKQRLLNIKEAFEALGSQVEIWEQDYVLRAPVHGTVSFTKYWKEHQNVVAGENVIAVVPEESSRVIGKLTLSANRAGKVKIGQTVNVKFKSYPYMEFGMVQGIIEKISMIPSQEDYYLVDVTFPDGLVTNYGIDLTLSQKMSGQAEIITEEVSLLLRIIRPIKSLIKNRSFRQVQEFNQ